MPNKQYFTTVAIGLSLKGKVPNYRGMREFGVMSLKGQKL